MRTIVNFFVAAARWCGQLLVTATIRAIVIGLIGAGLIWVGAGNEWGKPFVMVGFVLMGAATAYWLAVTLVFRTAADKAVQQFPTLGANVQGMVALGFAYFLAIAMMLLSDINLYPTLLAGLGILLVGLALSVAMPGVAKKLTVFNWRMGVGLAAVTIAFLWVHLPAQTQSRISFGAKTVGGMKPNRIPYTLDSLRSGETAFFRSIANSDGKSEPAIWVYFDQEEKAYYLYDKPGVYESNGDPLAPATRDLRKKIIKYLEDQEAQKVADKKVAEEQEVRNRQTQEAQERMQEEARLRKQRAEQEAILLASREKEEAERRRSEQEAEARRLESERRRLASAPIPVASTVYLSSTESSMADVVTVRPTARFTYEQVPIDPEQSMITLNITNVQQGPAKNQLLVTAQPQLLIANGGRRFDIAQRTQPVDFMAEKEEGGLKKFFGKTLGGAAAGAAVGALAGGKKGAVEGALVGGAAGAVWASISSHGYKLRLPVGGPMPPIMLKPVP